MDMESMGPLRPQTFLFGNGPGPARLPPLGSPRPRWGRGARWRRPAGAAGLRELPAGGGGAGGGMGAARGQRCAWRPFSRRSPRGGGGHVAAARPFCSAGREHVERRAGPCGHCSPRGACGGESRSGRVFEQRPFLRGWVPRGGMGGGSDPLVVRRVPSSRLGSGGAGSDALLQPRHPLRALRNGHRTGAGTLTLSFAARRRGSADAHPPGDGGRGGRFAFGARRGRPSRLRRGESCGGTPCPAAPCGRFPAVLQLCSQVSPRRLFPLRQLLRG